MRVMRERKEEGSLLKRISSFRAEELTEQVVGPDMPFVVRFEKRSHFFEYLCQIDPAVEHLATYPDAGKSIFLGVDSDA